MTAMVGDVKSRTPENIRNRRRRTKVRLFTFNILVSSFIEEYSDYPEEIKDTERRYQQIIAILKTEMILGSIIALQEVENDFRMDLMVVAAEHGYIVRDVQYGNKTNNYMGIALLWPNHYRINDYQQVRVGDVIAENYPPQKKTESYRFCPSWLFGNGKKKFDSHSYAVQRWNWLLMVRLEDTGSRESFNIATYHMPCAFWAPDVMKYHGETVLDLVHDFAGELIVADDDGVVEHTQIPTFIMGDFNTTPDKELYTTFNSQYKSIFDDEPEWTCWLTQQEKEGKHFAKEFKDTIDYIWADKDNEYTIEANIAELDEKLPTKEYPSDHRWLSAVVGWG